MFSKISEIINNDDLDGLNAFLAELPAEDMHFVKQLRDFYGRTLVHHAIDHFTCDSYESGLPRELFRRVCEIVEDVNAVDCGGSMPVSALCIGMREILESYNKPFTAPEFTSDLLTSDRATIASYLARRGDPINLVIHAIETADIPLLRLCAEICGNHRVVGRNRKSPTEEAIEGTFRRLIKRFFPRIDPLPIALRTGNAEVIALLTEFGADFTKVE